MRKKAEDVTAGDVVLRYGMWFEVKQVEILPAARGGNVYSLHLTAAPNRIPQGADSTLTLFPEETITYEHRQIATD